MRLLVLALLPFLAPAVAGVQEPTAPLERTLLVGTKEAAPFSFRGPDGEWRGLSIDLWRRIALDLGWSYELEERGLEALIQDLERGSLDASVAALTITAQREARVDFTHPFLTSGLGIAVPSEGANLAVLARRLLSVRFFQAVGTLAAVVLLGGFLMWVFERRKNAEEFGGGPVRGIGAGFWWSAVTMTTVGYGDKAPRTLGGRIVGLIWMFASVIMISGLTAAVATTLTLSQLESTIRDPQDLANVGPVVTVANSTSEGYLRDRGLSLATRGTIAEALEAVAAGEYRAMVYDAPILRHRASEGFEGRVEVLPFTLERQDYAFALPLRSTLRKPINRAMLEIVGGPEWRALLAEYHLAAGE